MMLLVKTNLGQLRVPFPWVRLAHLKTNERIGSKKSMNSHALVAPWGMQERMPQSND